LHVYYSVLHLSYYSCVQNAMLRDGALSIQQIRHETNLGTANQGHTAPSLYHVSGFHQGHRLLNAPSKHVLSSAPNSAKHVFASSALECSRGRGVVPSATGLLNATESSKALCSDAPSALHQENSPNQFCHYLPLFTYLLDLLTCPL
jgi:hypothetical protein